jgi:hypothetical protein
MVTNPASGGSAMNEQDMENEGDTDHIEKVRRRAHAIWMDQGQVHGRDAEHWYEAEREIAAEAAAKEKANGPAPTSLQETPAGDEVRVARRA